MAKLSAIRTDTGKENDGVWIPFELGIELKIARWNNPKFKALQDTLTDRRKVLLDKVFLPEEAALDVEKEAVAQTILLDWRNVEGEDGQPLAYSAEAAVKLFKDPEYKDLYTFVRWSAMQKENFRKQAKEETKGN